jgi:hypothetical protein
MAVKRPLIAVLLLLVAGAALIFLLLPADSEEPEFSRDDLKFIDAYIRLSVAGQMPTEEPEAWVLEREHILAESGVDSLWMTRYAESLSGDTGKLLSIWTEITDRLDSLKEINQLKNKARPQSSSTVNADSM